MWNFLEALCSYVYIYMCVCVCIYLCCMCVCACMYVCVSVNDIAVQDGLGLYLCMLVCD